MLPPDPSPVNDDSTSPPPEESDVLVIKTKRLFVALSQEHIHDFIQGIYSLCLQHYHSGEKKKTIIKNLILKNIIKYKVSNSFQKLNHWGTWVAAFAQVMISRS